MIFADMAESADAHGSGPCESNFMEVQVLLSAPQSCIARYRIFLKGCEFMAVYSVDELRMIVSDIAKQYGVKKVALFGSYSTGKQTSESDIDLLIDKGDIKGLFMLNSFINSLQDKLGKDVDVMTYSSLNRSLIKDSVRDEVVLYEYQR